LPKLLDVIEILVGPNIEIQHCKINWKPPEKGTGEVKWHQDFPYLPHTNHDLCAAFIVLDKTTPENGCMRVIPGSHKLGQLKHVDENGRLLRHVNDESFDQARHEPLDLLLEAGDMSIHHVLTLHSSYPNQSDNPRCAIIYEFRAADAMQIGGGLTKTTGVLVRGHASQTIRCNAGLVWIPPK
jgi:ectoine hydroxylase-related dioxygenase (phytanoyl-CoA dioxygenase family)